MSNKTKQSSILNQVIFIPFLVFILLIMTVHYREQIWLFWNKHLMAKVDVAAYKSTIPAYRIAAKRQILEILSLRRIELHSMEEPELVAVLDSVVVAPHQLQS